MTLSVKMNISSCPSTLPLPRLTRVILKKKMHKHTIDENIVSNPKFEIIIDHRGI